MAEPGPFYADIAAWSSILSTLLPMFGGFVVVATAQRSDSSFQSDDEEIAMQAVGLTLVGTGLVVGPSVGHLYAGDWAWGLGGMGLRLLLFAGGTGFAVGGFSVLNDDSNNAGGGLLLAGAAACGTAGLALAIFDLIEAPEAARRANREQRIHPAVPNVQIGLGSVGVDWTY